MAPLPVVVDVINVVDGCLVVLLKRHSVSSLLASINSSIVTFNLSSLYLVDIASANHFGTRITQMHRSWAQSSRCHHIGPIKAPPGPRLEQPKQPRYRDKAS